MILMNFIKDDSSISENILQSYRIKNNEKNKYSKKFVRFFILISIFIIFITIFLVLYFAFGCFQYKQDNITENFYYPSQIMLFNEEKFVNITIVSRNETEKNNQKLFNRFLVSINSKTRLNYFGVIDYLYNATIIILNSKIDDIIVIGYNYTDINKELTEDYLLNPHNAIISTFSFYENGTLGEIYLCKNTTEYFGSIIIDLIEQLIPRISKILYKNKNEKIEFIYDVDNKDENNSIINITENHLEKTFIDKYSNISFNGSKETKVIKRKISNDTIVEVICDSNLELSSENITNGKKGNYIDFGLESYNVRIISYLNLISKIKDEKLKDIIKLISKKFNFIESHNYFNSLRNKNDSNNKEDENGKENMYNNFTNEASSISNSNNLALRNLAFFERNKKEFGQNEFLFTLADFEILHKHFVLKFIIYISPIDLKLGYSFDINIDETQKTLSSNEKYLLGYSSDKNFYEKDLFVFPFMIFIVPLKLNLKFGMNYGINFNIDYKYEDIDTLCSYNIQPNIHAWLSGSLSTNFPVINLGVRAKGEIVGVRGDIFILKAIYSNSYIEGNLSLYSGPTKLTAFVELKYMPEINLFFFHIKEKKLEKEIELFSLNNLIEKKEKINRIFAFGKPKPKPKPQLASGNIYKPFSHAFHLNNILNNILIIILLSIF